MRRRGRPLAELVLTDSERTTLDQWTRRRTTAQVLALRARIVLACATGRTNSEVAADARVTRPTVGRWRQRFVEDRCEGLLDEPKPGAPRRITDADVERVLTTTLESTPRDATQWSTRSLAKQCGMSQTAVARIWKAFALQPHRSETFKLSKDPLFIEKVRDIVGLYLNPPDRALVLCVDEKSQIQALDRTAPLLPMRPGQVERRNALLRSLWHNVAVRRARCQDGRRRRPVFSSASQPRVSPGSGNLVEDHVPRDLDVHLILDNDGTHKTQLIQRWLAKRPAVPPPLHADELVLAEPRRTMVCRLQRKQIKRGAHRSVTALQRAIDQDMDVPGEDPKLFVCNDTAYEIFAHIQRFCQRNL